MHLAEFRITRFQFPRNRVIGDSQVRIDTVNVAAVELFDKQGRSGLGFAQRLFQPFPQTREIERVFAEEAWPGVEGQTPMAIVHRVNRPRGGNQRGFSLPFEEAVQVALWDLAAKQVDLLLHRLLGSRRDRVKAYASGLDYHLSDEDFTEFFGHADAIGYSAFKIKVGSPDFDRDLHRLNLLPKTLRPGACVMIDANEAWGAKETLVKLTAIRDAGYALTWVEDPILRSDFEGLRMLRNGAPWTLINSGEYLDAAGKRQLMLAGAIIAFWTGAGGWIIVMYGALNNISKDVMEAARVDGAGPVRTAWSIQIPLLRKWISYMVILSFAGGTQLFVEPRILSQASRGVVSQDYSLNQLAFLYAFKQSDFNGSAAISLVLLIVALALSIVFVFRGGLFERA